MAPSADFFELTGNTKTPELLLLEKELASSKGSLVTFKYRALGRSMISDNNTKGLDIVLSFVQKIKTIKGREAALRELMDFACESDNPLIIRHMLGVIPEKWDRAFFERSVLLGHIHAVEIFGKRVSDDIFNHAMEHAIFSKYPKKDIIHFLYDQLHEYEISALHNKINPLPNISLFQGAQMFFERVQVDEDKKILSATCANSHSAKHSARKI